MKSFITLVEVGPRDGLQNETKILSANLKHNLIKKLSQTGLRRIEAGSFVSPRWVPQMANSKSVIKKVMSKNNTDDVCFSALVPNERGMHDAISTGITEVAFFTSASETFNSKNINCSIKQSFTRLNVISKLAKKHKIKLRAYISCAFFCPYEGKIKYQKVVDIAKKLVSSGCSEISIGDTIGAATPREVGDLLKKILKHIPNKKIAMHFHDTRGMAIVNVRESLDFGIRCFDSSIGGMGGCPYAKDATGNLATEDLVFFLNQMGYETGVDLEHLLKVNRWLSKYFMLPSKVGRVGI